MYVNRALEALRALGSQEETIRAVQNLIKKAIEEDRLIHIFGTEARASSLIAEVFFRPGFPIHIDPMLDPTLDIAHGAYRNQMALEVDNLAPCILDYYERVNEGDPFILLGPDSKSKAFIQSLAWARAKKLKVIAITDDCTVADLTLFVDPKFFTVTAAAVLNMILEDMPEKWTGDRAVDLEENAEKIDRMLFRVRHL